MKEKDKERNIKQTKRKELMVLIISQQKTAQIKIRVTDLMST